METGKKGHHKNNKIDHKIKTQPQVYKTKLARHRIGLPRCVFQEQPGDDPALGDAMEGLG